MIDWNWHLIISSPSNQETINQSFYLIHSGYNLFNRAKETKIYMKENQRDYVCRYCIGFFDVSSFIFKENHVLIEEGYGNPFRTLYNFIYKK